MQTESSTSSNLSRAEFWQRAATLGFAAWAIMLPLAAGLVMNSLTKFTDKFDTYVLAMERRITLLEERQNRVLKVLEDHDAKIDRLDDQVNGRRR